MLSILAGFLRGLPVCVRTVSARARPALARRRVRARRDLVTASRKNNQRQAPHRTADRPARRFCSAPTAQTPAQTTSGYHTGRQQHAAPLVARRDDTPCAGGFVPHPLRASRRYDAPRSALPSLLPGTRLIDIRALLIPATPAAASLSLVSLDDAARPPPPSLAVRR